MTNTNGYRRGTRYMFARAFRKHGVLPLSTHMRVYKRGQYVTVMGNGAVQKGLPHKSYHGKTGRVFNVTRHGLGLILNKRVRGRIEAKRVNVRIEHVKPNRAHDAHLARIRKNEDVKREAKKQNKRVDASVLRRSAKQPREAHVVKTSANFKPELIAPIAYEFVV